MSSLTTGPTVGTLQQTTQVTVNDFVLVASPQVLVFQDNSQHTQATVTSLQVMMIFFAIDFDETGFILPCKVDGPGLI